MRCTSIPGGPGCSTIRGAPRAFCSGWTASSLSWGPETGEPGLPWPLFQAETPYARGFHSIRIRRLRTRPMLPRRIPVPPVCLRHETFASMSTPPLSNRHTRSVLPASVALRIQPGFPPRFPAWSSNPPCPERALSEHRRRAASCRRAPLLSAFLGLLFASPSSFLFLLAARVRAAFFCGDSFVLKGGSVAMRSTVSEFIPRRTSRLSMLYRTLSGKFWAAIPGLFHGGGGLRFVFFCGVFPPHRGEVGYAVQCAWTKCGVE